nr:hypothetical protein GCM10020092_051000 [Actinoplanes digitatis]
MEVAPVPRLRHRGALIGLVLALIAALTLATPRAALAADPLVSQGRPATASSTENGTFPASAAVDGNTGTRWSSAFSDPQWIQIDLGASYTISQVVLNWEAAYATSYQVQTSANGTTWTTVASTTTGTGGVQTLAVSGTGRYVRMNGTARATPYGYSLWEFQVFGVPVGGPTIPGGGALGPNVLVFDPSMSTASIQAQLNSVFSQSETQQFGNQRYELLFKPGTYNNLTANIGFYTSIAGLGRNPTDVHLNSSNLTVDAGWFGGNATQNFWRSTENFSVTPLSRHRVRALGGRAGRADAPDEHQHPPEPDPDRIRLGQRRIHRRHPDQRAAPAVLAAAVVHPQQQHPDESQRGVEQRLHRRRRRLSDLVPEPADHHAGHHADQPGEALPVPGRRELRRVGAEPRDELVERHLAEHAGRLHPADPVLRRAPRRLGGDDQRGPRAGPEPALHPRHLPRQPDDQRDPGEHRGDGPRLRHDHPGRRGHPDGGRGRRRGEDLQPALRRRHHQLPPNLLTIGPAGSSANHAANPTSVQDVFFRIGGAGPGAATNSLLVNSNNTLLDHIWAWRADHGAGVGWTTNPAASGLIVNGANVLALGLFVEHYQNYQVQWNGNGGRTIFFQNEMPYDPPTQAAWRTGANGYAAYKVADSVTTHEAWGVGSYCYFNVNPSIVAARGFEAPNRSGVRFHSLLTVSLGGVGSITNVINTTGNVAQGADTVPSYVVNYP